MNKNKSEYEDCLVILDAGHGGLINGKYVTPGKRSPIWSDGSQYFEGIGNREIRNYIAEYLNTFNINYLYLSSGEVDVPLRVRTDTENKLYRENNSRKVLVYSIHSNGASSSQAHGLEFFTSKGETKSDLAATCIAKRFMDEFPEVSLRKDMSDGDIDKESNLWITRKTIAPCVLGEHFFHTNEKECKEILMTEEGQRRIAKSVAYGIKDYFDKLI